MAAKQSVNTGNTKFAKPVTVYFKKRDWQCPGGPAGYVIEDDVLSDVFDVFEINVTIKGLDRRDGVVVRVSASQSVDLWFIPLIDSYQKTLKTGIHSFPAWCSAFRGGCGEQAGKFACCVLGQGTYWDAPAFMRKTGDPVFPTNRGLVAGRASDRKTNAT